MRSTLLVNCFASFICLATMGAFAPVAAQSLYSWGHASTYGQGYVGTPTYIPATSYYRAPQVASYGATAMPVITNYAPQSMAAPVTYVAPAQTYPPYPPQTVFPANFTTNYATVPAYPIGQNYAAANYQTYRPVVYYSPAPYANYYQPAPVANYATPAFYRTNYARAPVTYYRPVQVMDPNTGGVNTVLQPATGYEWQARRTQTYRLFPLFNRNQPTYPAGSCCNGAGCGSCAAGATAAPYYVPNATNALPYSPYAAPSQPGVFSNAPSTIAPPATFNPSGTLSPNTSLPPASLPPSLNTPSSTPLNPTDLNSGPIRRDYAPSVDSYPFKPNTSTTLPYIPPVDSSSSNKSFLPADQVPTLNAPASSETEVRRPQATIRRDFNFTPVPDPEVSGTGTSLKVKEPPQLLQKGDRTAQAENNTKSLKLVRFDNETAEPEYKTVQTRKPAMKVYGDDDWRPAGK